MGVERSLEVEPLCAKFATREDYRLCRSLHRTHGTTYFFATSQFPRHIRLRTHAIYGFVRTPDDWVDRPLSVSGKDPLTLLHEYRRELQKGCDGLTPSLPVMRAFCDVVREVRIPIEEPLLFLDSMEQDLSVCRYPTYESLRGYMRGSASSVGIMMCAAMEARDDPAIAGSAKLLGEAMQLTNFLRDVGEDAQRGRIYLPLEDLATFQVDEEEILNGVLSDRFITLMRFEIERARALYSLSQHGIELLPHRARKAVRLASVLYSRILNRIEGRGYDVFHGRARTSAAEKVAVAARMLAGLY